jgi:hypothetical protein
MDPSETELMQLWERPGLSWEIRTMIAPGLKDFKDDPGKSKTKNLETLLARLSPESREHIETMSIKKPSAFYDKLIAALSAERELIASKSVVKAEPVPEFDEIAAGFEEPAETIHLHSARDDMDLEAFGEPVETNEYESATRFVDQLLRGIKPARK